MLTKKQEKERYEQALTIIYELSMELYAKEMKIKRLELAIAILNLTKGVA